MKKVSLWKTLFTLVAVSFFVFACNKAQTDKGPQDVTQQDSINNPPPAEEEQGGESLQKLDEDGTVIHEASAEAPFISGIWHVEVWADFKDREAGNKGEGMWFKFEPNGTFTSGLWGSQTRSGNWKLIESRQIVELVYNNEPNKVYGYRYQGQGSSMVLIGQGIYQTNGVQVKLNREQDYPKK